MWRRTLTISDRSKEGFAAEEKRGGSHRQKMPERGRPRGGGGGEQTSSFFLNSEAAALHRFFKSRDSCDSTASRDAG